MQYREVDDISFTNVDGFTVLTKDKREIKPYDIRREQEVKEDDDLDEIASREIVFGNATENLVYKIIEANADLIVNTNVDMTRISKIRIPNK